MTSREFIAAENGNTDRIILYREGLFWKAYERSAFALCSQVRPLKPTRKVLKALDGGDLISVGFPSASEAATLGSLAVLERSDDRLTVSAPRAIVEQEFRVWKSSVPVKVAVPKRKPVVVAAVADDPDGSIVPVVSVVSDGTATELAGSTSVAAPHDGRLSFWGRLLRRLFGFGGHMSECPSGASVPAASEPVVPHIDLSSSASAMRIAQSLTDFDLADKTPMECMLFISELKKMLVKR